MRLSNLSHFIISQFRMAPLHSQWKPVLFHRVLHVILARSKKEVIRTYARRVVAFVTDQKTVRDWTVCKNPRQPVSPAILSIFKTHRAVTPRIMAASPYPALSRFVNKFPKSLDWCLSKLRITLFRAKPRLIGSFKSAWFYVKRFAALLANQRNWIGPSALHRTREHVSSLQSARRNQKLFSASLANDGDFGRTPFGRIGLVHRSFRYGEGLLASRLFLFTSTAAFAATLK